MADLILTGLQVKKILKLLSKEDLKQPRFIIKSTYADFLNANSFIEIDETGNIIKLINIK